MALFAVAACGDGSQGPLASVVTSETMGALALTVDLPTVALFTELVDVDLAAEIEQWESSWELPSGQGERLRDGLRRSGARGLRDRVTPELLLEKHATLTEVLDRVAALPKDAILPQLAERVANAQDAATRAGLAARDERVEEGLFWTLRAADELEALTPKRVAQWLTRAAEEALGRNDVDDAYSKESLDRATRLVRGARESLTGESYPRAIRRAFYACQLLGIEIH